MILYINYDIQGPIPQRTCLTKVSQKTSKKRTKPAGRYGRSRWTRGKTFSGCYMINFELIFSKFIQNGSSALSANFLIEDIKCEQSLFCSKIRGEERNTCERWVVTVQEWYARPQTAPRYSWLGASALASLMSHWFRFLHCVLLHELPSNRARLLAVYWDQQCLVALVESKEAWNDFVDGTFQDWGLSSKARISCLVLLPGCEKGATSFLPRIQCLQFQSNTFIIAGLRSHLKQLNSQILTFKYTLRTYFWDLEWVLGLSF